MEELLTKLRACDEAKEWAEGKSWQKVYATCHRGDWLLWLFARTNPDSKRELTLAKGHCANTVRHLMKDPRSIAAVDAAIAYGQGDIDDKELADAAAAAYDAARNADAAAYDAGAGVAAAAAADADADAAAYAAADAAAAAYAAAVAAVADAAGTAAAAYVADAAGAAARTENQQLTAEICRKYLPIEIWNI